MKSKQFEQGMKKLCSEASMVMTLNDHIRNREAKEEEFLCSNIFLDRESCLKPIRSKIMTSVATTDSPAGD